MKIVHVARRFTANAWGGTESVVASLVREQLRRGDDSRLLCTSALDERGEGELMGVPVERFGYTYGRVPLSKAARGALDRKGGNPLAPAMLWRMLNEPGVDLLHCHTMQRLAGQVRWSARRRGIPYVVQLHGGEFAVPEEEVQEMIAPTRHSLDWGKAPSALLGTRAFLRDADLILVLSRQELERGRARYPNTRIEQLPNAVETSWLEAGDRRRGRAALGLPEGTPVALTAARIDPQKGQELIPEILARVPALHAVLVGPVTVAGYEREVRSVAEGLGVADRLHLIGSLEPESETLADTFAAADLLLLPSRHEPFGIVALEAWAAGLPVVAARVGGLAELVRHGKDGFLAASGDASALAEAVANLTGNLLLARAMGDAGKRRVIDHYSWTAITERLDTLYASLDVGKKR
jgi:glycosyltransferase involved in cell wall biosynthesis